MNTIDTTPRIKLPNSTTVLTLGILSIPLCCCLGGIVGVALGIVALILAKKDEALYQVNPSNYDEKSYSNLKAGRICAIIGLCLSGLYLISYIWLFATLGLEVLTNPAAMKDAMQQMMSGR